MWTRADLKANGKIAFYRNYWSCVAGSVLTAFLCGEAGSGASGFFTGSNSNSGRRYSDTEYYGNIGHHGVMGRHGIVRPRVAEYNVNRLFAILAVAGTIAILIAAVAVLAFELLVGNVIKVGGTRYYMENREHQTGISQIFYGFRGGRYWKIVQTMFFKKLYIFLWSLLFVIPGIIKSYAYMMVPYLLSENPDMDRRRALELSEEMMKGHKGEAFVLELSFIGWVLLSGLTCGILMIFYVQPYVDATMAEYYTAIRAEALQKGIVEEYELPGYRYETF